MNISIEQLRAEMERLKAENEKLKAKRMRSLTMKVTPKGGIAVYGLQRFPVTLYKNQWERLFSPEFQEQIKAFIEANAASLTVKDAA